MFPVPTFPFLLLRGIVDRFKIGGEFLQVAIIDIFKGIAQHMDDAPLDLRLQEHSLDGIPEARQAVHTEKQDILYAPVLQVIQHSQPELGGFVLHLL